MKLLFSLMQGVCFVSLLFGCAGQQNIDTKPYVEATIIEGKTTKAEIIAVLGMPYSIGSEGDFSYYGSTVKAKITLVQRDGTNFSTNIGGMGGYYYLSINFDKTGIVSHVGLEGKN